MAKRGRPQTRFNLEGETYRKFAAAATLHPSKSFNKLVLEAIDQWSDRQLNQDGLEDKLTELGLLE